MISHTDEAIVFGSLRAMRAALRAREISPVEIVEAVLRRIAHDEPKLAAWVELDGDAALAAAHTVDLEGPLAGIPFGVKDVIDVRGLPTRFGAGVASSPATCDAWCVAAVRRAGVIPIGKVQTTAFAYADPAPTRNPWNLERTPGGSSAGSGAVVGAHQVPFAFGTQTGGSTLRPAAFNGVVGFKPTYGVIATAGVGMLAPTFDTVGIIARDAHDATEVFAICDARVLQTNAPAKPRLTSLLSYREDLSGPQVIAAIDGALEKVRGAGADVQGSVMPRLVDEVERVWRTVAAYESHAAIGAAVGGSQAGPAIRRLVGEGSSIGIEGYRAALESRDRIRAALDRLLASCDAVVLPAAGQVPERSTPGNAHFLRPWSTCGFPSISVPVGFDGDGMPIGMQLVTRCGNDGELLALARFAEGAIALENPGPRALLERPL
ncbi:MAG: amidase [Vulcanimicrobiaceae bacterium]